MQSEALKPCPFCGEDITRNSFWFCRKPAPPERYHIFCVECEFDGPGAETLDAAITAWNTRPSEDLAAHVPGLVEAARDLLANMTSTYQARNGRRVGIEADDGEKVWLVHSDLITALEAALSRLPSGAGGSDV